MRAFVLKASDLIRCKIHSLSVEHYHDDGTCRCFDTYKIVRFRRNRPSKVLQTGLTLKEARAYCSKPETSGKGWFDGYESEAK